MATVIDRTKGAAAHTHTHLGDVKLVIRRQCPETYSSERIRSAKMSKKACENATA
jgi:hypothetical protein